MKIVVLAALLATACACGSKTEPSAGNGSGRATPRPTVTDAMVFCERARALMTARQKCFPDDRAIKMGLETIADLMKETAADAEQRRSIAEACAVVLQDMTRAEQPKDCPLHITDDERAELSAFLATVYAQRTAPPATGILTVDAALVKLAGQRDVACACKDVACWREAFTELDAALPANAPTMAGDAAAKMVEDVLRCGGKLTNLPPKP